MRFSDAVSGSLAFAQAQPPGPVFAFQFRTPGLPQPARFQLVQSLLHFLESGLYPRIGAFVFLYLRSHNQACLRRLAPHGV